MRGWYAKKELAPVEDQSHISMFMRASPDASLAASNRASLEVVKAVTAFPEAKFMWSLTAPWGPPRNAVRQAGVPGVSRQ